MILATMLLPWKPLVEKKLVSMLAAKGVSPATIRIDHIGWRGLVLKDVTLGEPPLKLAMLTLAYRPRALFAGRIEAVEVNGLSIRAAQGEEGWALEGLGNLLRKKTSDAPAAIPVTKAELEALPLHSIALRDSNFQLISKAIHVQLPLRMLLQQEGAATLSLESIAPTVQFGENKITAARIMLDLVMNDAAAQWNGTWSIEDIAVTSDMLVLPVLQAKGTLAVRADTVSIIGHVSSADTQVQADFSGHYALNKPQDSFALLQQMQMPFNAGSLAAKEVKIILDGKKRPINFILGLKDISVERLLQTLTNNRATASGLVSGDVPVTITADGRLRVGKSVLKAQGPGMIALSPEVIPGDNPQVALVREVMKNLQYTVLALDFEMGADNSLGATLAVEGRNPDVEKGRPIKLNVNLSGDLLDLITQNVKLMTDPKTFIEQKHDKTLP